MRIFLTLIFAFILSACDERPPTANQVEAQRQEVMAQQANASSGMPAITHFAEKKMLKDILELRDKTPPTFVYITDMNGHLHKICDAVGYGFSGATQYTNPLQVVWRSNSGGYASGVIAQPDPNGLYSPATDEGTWVMCKDPHGTRIAPVRIEPRAIISPFELG